MGDYYDSRLISSFTRFESAKILLCIVLVFRFCAIINIVCWTQQEAVFVYINQKLTDSYFVSYVYIFLV